eukprot:gene14938-16478_t
MPATLNQRLLLQAKLLLIVALLRRKRKLLWKKQYRRKRIWVREIFQERESKGQFHTLLQELRLHDREYYFRYMRMSPERFEHLLHLVAPFIKKKKCNSRRTISPAEQLAVTIRYLATGDSQQSFNFRYGRTTICSYGKENDAQIFNNSDIGQAFLQGQMNLPDPRDVHGHKLPYIMVSDEIFGLKTWLMKPYPGRTNGLPQNEAVYNYRLSRCRRTIENAFGILTARWQIFRKPIKAKPKTVDGIVKPCLCFTIICVSQIMHDIYHLVSLIQKALMGILNWEIGGTWFHLILPLSQYLQERLLTAQPMQQNQLEGHSPTTLTALKERYLGKNHM